jgi:hypothetical protein
MIDIRHKERGRIEYNAGGDDAPAALDPGTRRRGLAHPDC